MSDRAAEIAVSAARPQDLPRKANTIMTSPPPIPAPGFFDLLDRHGNWVFLKIVTRMIVFFLLQQVRLVVLFVLRVIEGAMHRVDIARPLPAPTKPPPDTRDIPAPDPLGEDLVCAA